MDQQIEIKLTKSDFRRFREAPRHLWAKKHNCLDPASYDQLMVIQGEQVEQLAKEYFESFILPAQPGRTLSWQETRKVRRRRKVCLACWMGMTYPSSRKALTSCTCAAVSSTACGKIPTSGSLWRSAVERKKTGM